MNYDVIIIGAGPGDIFSAYELTEKAPELKIAITQAILLVMRKATLIQLILSTLKMDLIMKQMMTVIVKNVITITMRRCK